MNQNVLSQLGFISLVVFSVFQFESAAGQQQRNFDDIEIVPHRVAGNIYYLEGSGGNIGLSIGEDGVIMIDDQFAQLTEKIVSAIRELSGQEIRFLINTHIHGDHTGGNENFGAMGVMILAQDRVRLRLAEGLGGGQAAPYPEVALPVLTYSDAITLNINGEEVHAFSVPPAHTDGDSFVHFRTSDVLHLGDVFRTTGFPFIDVSNGGTVQGTLEALEIAIRLAGPSTTIIPGHGGLSTRDDVTEFRDMILTVTERVSRLISQNRTLDQVFSAGVTADFENKWGNPERFLTGLYQDLASNGN